MPRLTGAHMTETSFQIALVKLDLSTHLSTQSRDGLQVWLDSGPQMKLSGLSFSLSFSFCFALNGFLHRHTLSTVKEYLLIEEVAVTLQRACMQVWKELTRTTCQV